MNAQGEDVVAGIRTPEDISTLEQRNKAVYDEHTTIFHSLGGIPYRDDKEYIEYVQRIHTLRTKYGFLPKE
jgi:methyl coenzyme M reductase gamma subunit